MHSKFRSESSMSSFLDIVGDKWSLLVVRDMIFFGKKTFKDFLGSEERIATNILSNRLSQMTAFGIITKNKLPNNKKTNIYLLTEKGLDLIPVIVESMVWSEKYVKEYNPNLVFESMDVFKKDKVAVARKIRKKYIEKNKDILEEKA